MKINLKMLKSFPKKIPQIKMMTQMIKLIKHQVSPADLMEIMQLRKQSLKKMRRAAQNKIRKSFKFRKSTTIETVCLLSKIQTRKYQFGKLLKTLLERISQKFAYLFTLMSHFQCCRKFQKLWSIKTYWSKLIVRKTLS